MQKDSIYHISIAMKLIYPTIYLIVLTVALHSCKPTTNKKPLAQQTDSTNYIDEGGPTSKIPQINNEVEETRKIKDGTYTADVEYYNTTTGVNTLYVTKVHVEDGYLKVIKWPNGVWLASQYFKPTKIRKDGTCIISNLDAGYENRVKILDLQYY